jgi:hypothetical protein
MSSGNFKFRFFLGVGHLLLTYDLHSFSTLTILNVLSYGIVIIGSSPSLLREMEIMDYLSSSDVFAIALSIDVIFESFLKS